MQMRWTDPRLKYRRLARFLIPAAITMGLGAATGVGVAAAIHMPRVDTLASFSPARITQLYDRQGRSFASYARQRRIVLKPEEIPALMRNALIAVEDRNFYQHGGLDAVGVVRAAVSNLRSGRRTEGASTLTMQLARQLFFLNPGKLWRRKVEEAFIAVELEKSFTKDQLLALYLNVIYLGHGQYGVEAASRFYFGKSVSDLTLAEAATLAGIYQRPSRLSPYNAPEAVVARRNHVLDRMLEERFVRRAEHATARSQPLTVIEHGARDEVGSYFAEEVRRNIETTYGTATLLEKGLQVETTMDSAIEASAEKALRAGLLRLDHRKGWRGPHQVIASAELEKVELESWSASRATADAWFEGLVMASDGASATVRAGDRFFTLTPEGMKWTGKGAPGRILKRGDVAWFRVGALKEGAAPILILEQEPQLQGAAIVLESSTGAVRAMVGGWDFGRNQFNRATQARRQVGSAFKMFVYGTALENGFTPADTIFDAPAYFKGADGRLSYSPSNYYPTYYGITTLSRALEQSYNVSAVKLLDLVGADKVIEFARRCGVRSDLPPYPSLALGSADVSPLEMAAAYAVIANQGRYTEPYLVERIRLPEGEVLAEHRGKSRVATTPELAYVLSHMLEGVVDRGTAAALNDLPLDIAGKTGTTNDYSNAWFIGFTTRYTMLIWVGYDRPRSMGRGMAGDKVAVPIWRDMAVDGLETGWLAEKSRFTAPEGMVTAWIDRGSGLKVAAGTKGGIPAVFLPGTQPGGEVSGEWANVLSLPWYQQRPFYQGRPREKMPEDMPPEAPLPLDVGPEPGSESGIPPEAGTPPETAAGTQAGAGTGT